jgi:hypothetical protein
MEHKSIKDVLQAAEDRLNTAKFGLRDMGDPERSRSGLYNAVVFGRMVTFALQNLRGVVSNFDDWYGPKQQELRSDPLMRYFHDLRTEIEKKTTRHTATSVYIPSLNPNDLRRFPRPPGATGFFIGDQNGGSGWEIKRADGSIEKYYVELPPSMAQVTLHLPNAPDPYKGLPARELVQRYLHSLEMLVAEARQRFS